MSTQKLYRQGNKILINIPPQLLEKLNLKEGNEIRLTRLGRKIILTPSNTDLAPDVDVKFMKMVEDFANENQEVLTALAKR